MKNGKSAGAALRWKELTAASKRAIEKQFEMFPLATLRGWKWWRETVETASGGEFYVWHKAKEKK